MMHCSLPLRNTFYSDKLIIYNHIMSFRIMFFFGIIVGLVDLFLKIDEIVVFLPAAFST